ncbi:MAG: cytochrome C oxidase, partial [Alphaproteobacteria bacterium]|nr:cytochrome C oxidase [Alphaproteobacteria bacterium]
YSFVETVQAMHPYYVIRTIGGLLYLGGVLIMAYNLWRTVRSSETAATEPAVAPLAALEAAQ